MDNILVYVLGAGEMMIDGGYELDIWSDHERAGEELPDNAIEFMKLAKEKNQVYSLKGFMVLQNINEELSANDFVFITEYNITNHVRVKGNDLIKNDVVVGTIDPELGAVETTLLVNAINQYIKDNSLNHHTITIKNDDDNLGVIVDIWDEKQTECIDGCCFYFDDFLV